MTPLMNGECAFYLRPGTNDDTIYRAVVMRNEYRVPERFAEGAIVVDLGVHVGAFSYLVLTRGADEVHGFEPEPANYHQRDARSDARNASAGQDGQPAEWQRTFRVGRFKG